MLTHFAPAWFLLPSLPRFDREPQSSASASVRFHFERFHAVPGTSQMSSAPRCTGRTRLFPLQLQDPHASVHPPREHLLWQNREFEGVTPPVFCITDLSAPSPGLCICGCPVWREGAAHPFSLLRKPRRYSENLSASQDPMRTCGITGIDLASLPPLQAGPQALHPHFPTPKNIQSGFSRNHRGHRHHLSSVTP